MSDLLSFVSAVCGLYDGPIAFDVDGVPTPLSEGSEIAAHEGSLRIQSLQPNGDTPFVWGLMDVDDGMDFEGCRVRPTAVLAKDNLRLLFWAFDSLYPREALQPFADMFDGPLDEPVPTPGTDGWVLASCDADVYYTFQDFERAYAGEEEIAGDYDRPAEETAPWDDEPEVTWASAKIKTPGYVPDNDPILLKPFTVTVGGSRDSYNWKPQTMALGNILGILCDHKVGKKDGMAFVLGDMAPGTRKITAVKSLGFVGLDLDTGMDGAEIDKRLAKLGCLAVRYTTHSHMKGVTEVRKDTMTRWAIKTGIDPNAPDLPRRYLQEEKHYDPAVAASAVVFEEKHVNEGITLFIKHAPMPKHRIVLPLAEPFEIAKEGNTQKDAQDRWRLVPQALARLLGDLPIDRTGSDANRLYYLPRHEKDAEFEASLFGGPLFDWKKTQLVDPLEELAAEMNKGKSRSTTPMGKELGKFWIERGHGFQIADLIRDEAPDRIRSDNGHKLEIECPFDEEHSNAGDIDDKACMVANAGDGGGEGFVITCRHDTCQDRTGLDMLGKMVTDQWFEKSSLRDENYNALAPEDAPNPEAAIEIAAQEDAREGYEKLVDALTKDSSAEDIEAVLKCVLEADLPQINQIRIDAKIKRAIGFTERAMKMAYAGPKATLAEKAKTKSKSHVRRDAEGRIIFAFSGDPDEVSAAEVCKNALKVANNPLPLFAHMDQKPVTMIQTESGRVRFDSMSVGRLWAELNERVTFMRIVEEAKEGARTFIPKPVSEQLYHKCPDFLPQAPQIIYTPIFNRDGQLISEPGWYPADELLMPESALRIPNVSEFPTDEEVETAKTHLLGELFGEFPFNDVDEHGAERSAPSRSHALAMTLTPFMRPMISGCTPVFFVTKPLPGIGGTLLGEIPIRLYLGIAPTSMNYTDNQEEMSKALLSAAMNANRFMFFDDVKAFNNREIMRATTSGNIGGRVLGGNTMAEVANDFTWIATGNNPYITPEMGRRICYIRLNAKLTPADLNKRKFKHANMNDWVMETREVSIHAILTLIRNWIAKGMENFEDRKLTSFEDWSRKVGGVLQAAGIEGFLDNARAIEADITEAAIHDLVKQWLQHHGRNEVTSTGLYDLAEGIGNELIEGNKDDARTKKKFVSYLSQIENRTFQIDDKLVTVIKTLDKDRNPVFKLQPLETEVLADVAA